MKVRAHKQTGKRGVIFTHQRRSASREISSEKKMLFLLAVVVFLVIGSIIVEAKLSDIIANSKTRFGAFKSDFLTKQRIVNYALLTVVLIIASLIFLKDKMGDDKTKYMIWIACFIVAIILTVHITEKAQYIWQKEFVKDGKRYLLGDDTARNDNCDGDGAYYDDKPGVDRCRQGILRTNQQKGLPSFIIALLVLLLVFSKYKDTLGFGENKKLMYSIAAVLAAIIANGGAEKEHLITMGGWILIAILYFSFKEKMPEKAAMAFGLAYACIESLANLFGSTLLWGSAPVVVDSWVLIKNFAIGIGFAMLWQNSFGEGGVMRHAFDKMGEKKKRDIDELVDEGKIGQAFITSLPVIGSIFGKKETEGGGKESFWDRFKEGFLGKIGWFKRRKKEMSEEEAEAEWADDLMKAKEDLAYKFESLKRKLAAYYPYAVPNIDDLLKKVDKLDPDDITPANVEKAIVDVLIKPYNFTEEQKQKITDEFIKPLVVEIYSDKKKGKNYANLLKRQKDWAKKREEERPSEPFDMSQATPENIKEKEEKARDELRKEYKDDFARPYAELARKIVKGVGAPDINVMINYFDKEINFEKVTQEEIYEWLMKRGAFTLRPETAPPENRRELDALFVKLVGMFARYVMKMNNIHEVVRSAIDVEFEDLGAHNYKSKDWELIIQKKREVIVDKLAKNILKAADENRLKNENNFEDFNSNHVIARDKLANLAEAKKRANGLLASIAKGRSEAYDDLVRLFKNDISLSYIDKIIDWVIRDTEEKLTYRGASQDVFKKKLEEWQSYREGGSKRSQFLQQKIAAIFWNNIDEALTEFGLIRRKEDDILRAKTVEAEVHRGAITRIGVLLPENDDEVFIERDKHVDHIILSKTEVSIGTDDSSDIKILDSSRTVEDDQAHIVMIGDGVYKIYDKSSDSGTFVNDDKVTGRNGKKLNAGDVIDLGKTVFKFKLKIQAKIEDHPWHQYKVYAKRKYSEEEQRKHDEKVAGMTMETALAELEFKKGEKPTFDEVRKRYRQLAVKYHYDKVGADKAAAEKMMKINAAYEFLTKEHEKNPGVFGTVAAGTPPTGAPTGGAGNVPPSARSAQDEEPMKVRTARGIIGLGINESLTEKNIRDAYTAKLKEMRAQIPGGAALNDDEVKAQFKAMGTDIDAARKILEDYIKK
ncbi:MAG: DnaJ domain-containing protein [Nanoarchaeota archaeon]|nr:DnaJ domain-containing protein [Nanoarchaeota archaeon]